MAVERCFSSEMMTVLLKWRNPQGPEENWNAPRVRIENEWKHLGKVVTTEISLCCIATAAAVETVSYATLALLSLSIYPINKKPYKLFVKLLESSSFTIGWTLTDAFVFNPAFRNLLTHESYARGWTAKHFPIFIKLYRHDDRVYRQRQAERLRRYDFSELQLLLQQLQQQANVMGRRMAERFQRDEPRTAQNINEGAQFIKDHVLAGVSPEIVELFKETDPSIYPFVLTKAIYLYTVGFKKNDPVPAFFKEETQTLISTARSELPSDLETVRQLEGCFLNLAQFEAGPTSEAAKAAFTRLRVIASGELSGLFIISCWQKAVEMLRS